jgi:hypothetical protein
MVAAEGVWVLDMSRLKSLTSLRIERCWAYCYGDDVHGLSNLTDLNIIGCENFSFYRFSCIPIFLLPALTTLNLTNCGHLEELRCLSSFTALTDLNLSGCWRLDVEELETLSSLAFLTNLNTLDLRCSADRPDPIELTDEALRTLRSFTALTTLYLGNCNLPEEGRPAGAAHRPPQPDDS